MILLLSLLGCAEEGCAPHGAPCAGGEGVPPAPQNIPLNPRPDHWLSVHAAPIDGRIGIQVTEHGYVTGVSFDRIEVVDGGAVVDTAPLDLEGPILWEQMCEWPETVASLHIEPDTGATAVLVDVDMSCAGGGQETVRVRVPADDPGALTWAMVD